MKIFSNLFAGVKSPASRSPEQTSEPSEVNGCGRGWGSGRVHLLAGTAQETW